MKQLVTKYLANNNLAYSLINDNNIKDKTLINLTNNAVRNTQILVIKFFGAIKAITAKPVIISTTKQVQIYIFYYLANKKKALNYNTINNLGEVLTKLYKRPVQLRFSRLYYPFLDVYMLAQYIGVNRQDYKLVNIIRPLFNAVNVVKNTQTLKSLNCGLPSHIVGIKVRVSGRLSEERSRPRFTVQTAEIGTFSKHKLSLMQVATYTSKNKKNAYTVKVWLNQHVSRFNRSRL